MIDLAKPIRRRAGTAEGRPLVVSLIPAAEPLLELRPLGLRSGVYSIPLSTLYEILALREADRKRDERRGPRRRRIKL